VISTKILYGCATVGIGAIIAGDLAKQAGPALDPMEKYGVLGLLAILCVGLLALINKLSDNIRSNTAVSHELVIAIKLIHQEQREARTQLDNVCRDAVGEVLRHVGDTRKEIVDEIRRTK
jgi:hypothetical protein